MKTGKERGGFPARKARIAELEAENDRLRQALGIKDKHTDLEGWGAFAPQDLRDQMAASALVAEKLDAPRALVRLGFKLDFGLAGTHRALTSVTWDLCDAVFGTPGVQAILKRDLADAEANKTKVIARLVQTAVHGEDGESTRAVQSLSRIAGWNKDEKAGAEAANVTFNLLQMFGNKPPNATAIAGEPEAPEQAEGVIDAEFFLTHEPGEATLVSDVDQESLPK